MPLSKENIYTTKDIYDLPEGHLMQGLNGLYGDSQSEKRSLFQTRFSKEKGNCNRLWYGISIVQGTENKIFSLKHIDVRKNVRYNIGRYLKSAR